LHNCNKKKSNIFKHVTSNEKGSWIVSVENDLILALTLNWVLTKIGPIQKMNNPTLPTPQNILKSHTYVRILKFYLNEIEQDFKLNVLVKKMKFGWEMENCHCYTFHFFVLGNFKNESFWRLGLRFTIKVWWYIKTHAYGSWEEKIVQKGIEMNK
jgi:mannose/cellobiose epimerase-like protein (N-acyl-D-glucosamine 2-epimerase family)